MPVAAVDALSHSIEHIGESDDSYTWMCPEASGNGYTLETFELHIDGKDLLGSARTDIMRQPTRLVACPYTLVDPDDRYVRAVADYLLEITDGCGEYSRAEAALSFVQCAIDYEQDSDLFGTEEFWASPAETLYLHRGDCEDTSVLLCSIYLAMGISCAMLDFRGHVAVGVYLGDSEDYLICETTFDTPHRPGCGGSASMSGPEVHSDFSGSLIEEVNGFFASYRNLVRSVAGT